VLPGVYRFSGTPHSYAQDLWAAHLWQGDESALSHATAAVLWEFDGFGGHPVEISSTNRKRCSGFYLSTEVPVVVHRVDDHLISEIMRIDDLPVTSPRRTLLDLAGRKDRRVGRLLDQGLRRNIMEIGDLWIYVEQGWMRGRRGVRILRGLLAERTPGLAPTDSDLELELRRHLDAAGLPEPTHQCPVEIPQATIHIDLSYPDRMLAIEVDGFEAHADKDSFDRDRERDGELSLLGWTVLRFTWAQIRYRHDWVVELIRKHLDRLTPSVR
jgi:very-short-patch-repair endonuclease